MSPKQTRSETTTTPTRRRSAEQRWSASSTVEFFDDAGTRLDGAAGTAVKGRVRWRVDGKNRKRTFSGPGFVLEVRAFQASLRAAFEGDWPAGSDGAPVQPTSLRVVSEPVAPSPAAAGVRPLRLPSAASMPEIRTVADVCDAFEVRLMTTNGKKGKRRPKTLEGYKGELDFIRTHLVYPLGDPRLENIGAKAGDSLQIGEENGLVTADLIRFIDIRTSTNLATRTVNERRMLKWAKAVLKAERLSASKGATVAVSPPPVPEAEAASPRTIEESCRMLKALLEDAVLRGEMAYQPWTFQVDELVPVTQTPHFTTREVPSADQVCRIGRAISTWERQTTAGEIIDGGRYEALVRLMGLDGPREGECFALRTSSLRLDAALPHLVCRGSVSFVSKSRMGEDGGRQLVGLKHRPSGSERVVLLEAPTVAALRRHTELYVPKPDPQGASEDERDPYLFTTHTGAPLHSGNFLRDWFAPAVVAGLTNPGEERFHDWTPRDLRKAAISRMLHAGWHLAKVAIQVGNSPAVIEKHYMGIISEIQMARPELPATGDRLVSAASDEDLEAELRRRRMRSDEDPEQSRS